MFDDHIYHNINPNHQEVLSFDQQQSTFHDETNMLVVRFGGVLKLLYFHACFIKLTLCKVNHLLRKKIRSKLLHIFLHLSMPP